MDISYKRILGTISILGLSVWLSWQFVFRPIQDHKQFSREVRKSLESLANNRPQNITRKQWQNIIAWTINAHYNCLSFSFKLSHNQMINFEKELKQRVSGLVTLDTIDWIWDEFAQLAPDCRMYLDQYRPTTAVRLKEFEEDGWDWGITVK